MSGFKNLRMRLIKLNTTSSTNDFLKEMAASQPLDNFTTVTAENQTDGRGQMGAKWDSEIGKNLIMSVFIEDFPSKINQLPTLNIAVAVAVISALKSYKLPEIRIKWPNDIMSGNKKIGGILIENTFKSGSEVVSVAGIGLNVNQTDFSTLPRASSLAEITGKIFNKEQILNEIVSHIEKNMHEIEEGQTERLWNAYHEKLFKIGIPMPFEDNGGNRFMAIIQKVTRTGKLQLLLENDATGEFEIKEIRMLY